MYGSGVTAIPRSAAAGGNALWQHIEDYEMMCNTAGIVFGVVFLCVGAVILAVLVNRPSKR